MGEMKVYNNNPNIKGVGQSIQFTSEQIQEYLKCSEDPVYFVNNYCKIVTLDFGLQPFKTYPYQERLFNNIQQNRKVIAMMPRQQGKCVKYFSCINIRNKTTGEIKNVKIGEFFDSQNMQKLQ